MNSNSPQQKIESKTTAAANGTVIEEHWVIHQFFVKTEQEVMAHLGMLRHQKSTGQFSINLQQGGIGMIEFRTRGAKILRPNNESA